MRDSGSFSSGKDGDLQPQQSRGAGPLQSLTYRLKVDRRVPCKKRPATKRASYFLLCNTVIVIHRASSRRGAPVPSVVVAVFRRSLELRFGDARPIAAKPGIVFQ